MYLRSLEMIGFKSFAGKTKLEFEPGMTCIVGPNGCGKSNIADAVRWVIGEQSAKALRGATMQDCIFNGTDARKPLGMAEVSITFAQCEGILDTEYDEITVTRRVLRSGEGQYFINKTPCRLKDIQRLFMDTGVGTTSYSLMEQGRIDRVLSSRPEDRRAVFEEASGITKFKADKKEAIRKLEHTEANLLRLADVIREVKRQIGSLQRQAGKARRYKSIQEELRSLDIYLTRERVKEMDARMKSIDSEMAGLTRKADEIHEQIGAFEEQASRIREQLARTEEETAEALESGVQARSKLDHTRELISTNQQRITEYQSWKDRDSREIDQNQKLITEHEETVEVLSEKRASIQEQHDAAEQQLKEANESFARHQQSIDNARSSVQTLREESVELESLTAKLQNQLVEIESRDRSTILQRERLAAEKAQLGRASASFEKRQSDMAQSLEEMKALVTASEEALSDVRSRLVGRNEAIRDRRQASSDLRSEAAAKSAEIALLEETEASHEGSPEGTRLLLDESNPLNVDRSLIMGVLAQHVDVEEDFRKPLEAVVSSRLEAVLVKDQQSALDVLRSLEESNGGSASLQVAAMNALDAPEHPDGMERLLDHVKFAPELEGLGARLLAHVFVADSISDIGHLPVQGTTFVTRSGVVMRSDGSIDFFSSGSSVSSTLGRKRVIADTVTALKDLNRSIEQREEEIAVLGREIAQAENELTEAQTQCDQNRRAMAQKEGETQIVTKEAKEARDRLDTVTWELDNLESQGENSDEQKKSISQEMMQAREQRERIALTVQEQSSELQKLESRHYELQGEVMEKRVAFAELSQEIRHVDNQYGSAVERVRELKAAIEGRAAGIQSYQESIVRLTAELDEAQQQLQALEEDVRKADTRAGEIKAQRAVQEKALTDVGQALTEARDCLEVVREKKSSLEVRQAEGRMRRENQIERITADYHITIDQLIEAPDPEWKEEIPPMEAIETMVAEYRTKLDAMGPVNLVAIEEYKELEERYSFLTAQEHDLVQSKEQLMAMIRKINKTTSDLFRTTFEQVNMNFQSMFKNLFNGGSAKLVLVNEEDVLECGIEIIARPPGKRLQNVSLLSGGERTLTAVALLFAIYEIKPSPFCLLDELDAALDDANIGRFVAVLSGFLDQSQFLVITHNRQTIAAAASVYGITMPEKGISNIMSMRFQEEAPAETQPQLAGVE